MESNKKNSPVKPAKKRKKKKINFGYLYLFTFVFLAAFFGLSYIVKSYAPDTDVSIGNNDSLTLNDSDMDVEIKTVDERLKWIQMEDEMPSVAVRENEKQNEFTYEETGFDDTNDEPSEDREQDKKGKNIIPRPNINDIEKQRPDFRTSSVSEVIPKPQAPDTTVAKVFLGKYSTVEEAMKIQEAISSTEPDIIPFIKAVNDYYIVQLGSFSDKEKAHALVTRMQTKGYNPEIINE